MSSARDDQKEHFRDVLRSIHLIMVESFKLRQVKVTPSVRKVPGCPSRSRSRE